MAIVGLFLVLPILTVNQVYSVDWPEEPYQGPAPIFQIDCTEDSNGNYRCVVIKTTRNYDLTGFQYFIKDPTCLTHQFGEIALQNISGQWKGIDVTWDDDERADTTVGNAEADRANSAGGQYSDPSKAQLRIDAVQTGYQNTTANQKSEGIISVSFSDNDRNGKLTAGDQFMVRGNSRDHPANDDWRLEVKYDITDDTIGTFKLGA